MRCLEPKMLYPENEYINCEETEKTDWTREDDEVKEEDKKERKRLNTMAVDLSNTMHNRRVRDPGKTP